MFFWVHLPMISNQSPLQFTLFNILGLGIAGADAIVEVKCIYSPNEEANNLEELIKKMKSRTCLKLDKE
jgi:hypothetical protein